MPDLRQFADYPFLRKAAEYVRDKGPSLDELLTGPGYGRARALGKDRVAGALEKGAIAQNPTATEVQCLIELLSYPIARMIVSSVNDSYLTRRYALAEAERAHAVLAADTRAQAFAVASELGIDAEDGGAWTGGGSGKDPPASMHFADYLRHASAVRGPEWKLVNQEILKGRVVVPWPRFLRLLQQAIQVKIESELPLQVGNEIKSQFKEEAKAIRALIESHKKAYKAEDLGKMSVIYLPPCIRRLLAMAQAGENVPHQGRFALVTFLHALGMSADDIMRLFSLSPDFDPKKSRYQVEHITGVISHTEYTPPECSTMKTYNLCFEPDSLCGREWMTHPLKYYRAKKGRGGKGRGAGAAGDGKSPADGQNAPGQGGETADGSGPEPQREGTVPAPAGGQKKAEEKARPRKKAAPKAA